MVIPDARQIKTAYDAIAEAGPGAHDTIRLCCTVLADPILRDAAERYARVLHEFADVRGDHERLAFIVGVLAHGMNLGLRIASSDTAAPTRVG
jgi:hypothetical protein